MKVYFLTIRKHQVKDYVRVEDLQDIVKCLSHQLEFTLIDLAYELDPKYQQLHSHLMVQTLRTVYYKKHSSIKGFRLYWRLVVDQSPTKRYIHKNSHNKYEQEQIIITNYYRHHYGFIFPID